MIDEASCEFIQISILDAQLFNSCFDCVFQSAAYEAVDLTVCESTVESLAQGKTDVLGGIQKGAVKVDDKSLKAL